MTEPQPNDRPLLVLTGTTASGKTKASLFLAERLRGEVISLDSMKIYRKMDIGTDKPTAAAWARVPHHLIDIVDPADSMNLSIFCRHADAAVELVRSRSALPIVVGGTALYLQGFLYGIFEGPAADLEFRENTRTEAKTLGIGALHERLKVVDPLAASKIHPNDLKRIERALEVFKKTGKPISSLQSQWGGAPRHAHRTYVLTWARAVLDRRINDRVDQMFQDGLVDEVRCIREGAGFGPQSSQALGYKEVLEHLDGRLGLDEAKDLVKTRTRRFARRQLTWFRRMKDAVWIVGTPEDDAEKLADSIVKDFERARVAC